MDELTRLLSATQSASKALAEFERALQAFGQRVELTTTLSDDDVPGLDDPGDPLDPPIDDDEMRALLSRAAGTLGPQKVREVILDECGGRQLKASEMAQDQRQMVRIALELLGVKRSA